MSGGERQEGARSAEHGAARGEIGWRGGPLEALRAFLAARAGALCGKTTAPTATPGGTFPLMARSGAYR